MRLRLDAATDDSSSGRPAAACPRVVSTSCTAAAIGRGDPARADRLLDALRRIAEPRTREQLRADLHVRNEPLGEVLQTLEKSTRIHRAGEGWYLATATANGGQPVTGNPEAD
ncbi:MAG: hypothetical protein HYV63_00910 [Candidatus Schekmanbacteria bacterium]|nr:hypothetical protein [Candidatus Schekmanbacteria bacterium]